MDERGAGYLQMRWRILGSLEVSLAHVLSGIAVRILSVVLRTVISCGRDEYGAVEKTLRPPGYHRVLPSVEMHVVVALKNISRHWLEEHRPLQKSSRKYD